MDEKWSTFGSTMIDAIIYFQIFALISIVLFIVMVVLVACYLKKAKEEKTKAISITKIARNSLRGE